MKKPRTIITMLDSDVEAIKARLLHQAAQCGSSVVSVVEALWASYLLDGLYHCRHFIRLADIHSKARLEAASRRALYYGQANYRTVRRILQRHTDQLPLRTDTDIWGHTWPSAYSEHQPPA
jgi:hypothetical protein